VSADLGIAEVRSTLLGICTDARVVAIATLPIGEAGRLGGIG
jgi:hypothetical protein